MGSAGGARRVGRVVRVRRLARALREVLRPEPGEPPPVVPASAWKKVEMLAFGLDRGAIFQFRDALETFGVVTPVEQARADGSKVALAWLVRGEVPRELEDVSEDDGDEEAEAPPEAEADVGAGA